MTISQTLPERLLPESAVAELATVVDGPVFAAGDDGYTAGTSAYHLAVTRHPAVVVGAASAQDVQEAVRFARRRRLAVAVQATGHDVPVPADDTVLISTSHLTGVEIDPDTRTARVEAGVPWQRVIDEAARFGLAGISGSSPDAGVVGYTLGDGLSPALGRSYGYAADHVIEVDLVTAAGELRTVSATSDPDLFWAVRGGTGNFGVVTAIRFRLFPVSRLYGGGLFFASEHARRVLKVWRNWIGTISDAMSSSVEVLRMPPLEAVPEPIRGRLVLHVRIAYLGPAQTGEALILPLRGIADRLLDTVAEMPYTAAGSIHTDPVGPAPNYKRTALLRDVPPEAMDRIADIAVDDDTAPLTLVEVRHLGGALRRSPEQPSAVVNRDAAFLLVAATVTGPDNAAPAIAAQAKLVGALAPWDIGKSQLNFRSARDTITRAYPEETYDQLAVIKQRWDPQNMFRPPAKGGKTEALQPRRGMNMKTMAPRTR